jgi:hypothetical protein
MLRSGSRQRLCRRNCTSLGTSLRLLPYRNRMIKLHPPRLRAESPECSPYSVIRTPLELSGDFVWSRGWIPASSLAFAPGLLHPK